MRTESDWALAQSRKAVLFEESDRLYAGNFKTFAAAHVFAGHHVISADHIGARLGELRAVALVSTGRELPLFSAYQPGELIFSRLSAMRTKQRVRPLLLFLVEHIALFHASPPRGRKKRLLHNGAERKGVAVKPPWSGQCAVADAAEAVRHCPGVPSWVRRCQEERRKRNSALQKR